MFNQRGRLNLDVENIYLVVIYALQAVDQWAGGDGHFALVSLDLWVGASQLDIYVEIDLDHIARRPNALDLAEATGPRIIA